MKTYNEIYLDARSILRQSGIEGYNLEARLLVAKAANKSIAQLLRDINLYTTKEIENTVIEYTARRLRGEPVAYITGSWEFYGLPMNVTSDVLIPRMDTEVLVDTAKELLIGKKMDARILDLCCGSGCIGLAIASRVKDAKVTLADLSLDALSVAKENAALNKLSGRVRCIQADALKPAFPFLGKYDMIVSNPPYITGEEMKELPRSVADYEPHLALFGGEDGLDFYRSIVKNFAPALKPGGYLAFEFGDTQADAVCAILEENGYTILERARDYNDRERAVLAQYGRKEA